MLRQIEQRATGRATVGAGAAEVSVYLMNGELIAAETPDDERVLIHLLQRQGVLRRKVATELEARRDAGESVFGELLKYGGHALDDALYARFQNNLATFLGSSATPEFEAMKGVFVDNIQMGHDTAALIDEACLLWDEATRLDIDSTITTGSVPFETDQQLWIAKAVGRAERTVSAVLLRVPMEELHARTAVLEMLDKGMLQVPGMALEEEDAPTDTATPEDEDEAIEDQETVFGIDVNEVRAALEEEDANAAPAGSEADTVVDSAPEPEPEPAPEPEPEPEAAPAGFMPSSLDQWRQQAAVVSDDELDFFKDHDHDRGSADQGAFSTQSHNLDRVEVMDLSAPEPEPEPEPEEIPIAADEAPSAKFSAPLLSEEDALEKLDVANEVLANVVRAFDSAEGAGRGRSLVQLLTDGSPAKFSVLLNDLNITEDGALPDDQVMANLYARPPTEHRQLLNNALVDLIDRAISSAADELPDEHFDDMYEAVSGYRQRLGL